MQNPDLSEKSGTLLKKKLENYKLKNILNFLKATMCSLRR